MDTTMMYVMIVFLVTFLVASVAPEATFDHLDTLFNDVIMSKNRRVRPARNQSEPTTVSVSFNLMSVVSLDEREQKIEVNAWMGFRWTDDIRAWDPQEYGGINVIHPEPIDIWRPRVILSGSLNGRDVFEDYYCPTAVFADGTTVWNTGAILEISCPLDMTYFPFDEQSCTLGFFAMEYSQNVVLTPMFDTANTNSYTLNGEWELKSTKVSGYIFPMGDVAMSSLRVTLNLQRNPQYYLVNVLIPLIFLSSLSSLVFVLPAESGEKASFSVTILLALSVYMSIIAGQMPHNADTFPMMAVYMFSLFIHSGACMFTTICHLMWMHRTSAKEQSSRSSDGSHDAGTHSFSLSTSSHAIDSRDLGDKNKLAETKMRSYNNNPEFGFNRNETTNGQYPDFERLERSFYNPAGRFGEARDHPTVYNPTRGIQYPEHVEVVMKPQPNTIKYPAEPNSHYGYTAKSDWSKYQNPDQRLGVCGHLIKWLKNPNVLMFVIANVVWVGISASFLYRLSSKFN